MVSIWHDSLWETTFVFCSRRHVKNLYCKQFCNNKNLCEMKAPNWKKFRTSIGSLSNELPNESKSPRPPIASTSMLSGRKMELDSIHWRKKSWRSFQVNGFQRDWKPDVQRVPRKSRFSAFHGGFQGYSSRPLSVPISRQHGGKTHETMGFRLRNLISGERRRWSVAVEAQWSRRRWHVWLRQLQSQWFRPSYLVKPGTRWWGTLLVAKYHLRHVLWTAIFKGLDGSFVRWRAIKW